MKLFDWAGIGARKTPADIIKMMKQIGFLLSLNGGCCNTGAAKGADQAFADGSARADGIIILSLPWPSYEAEWIQSIQPPEFSGLVETEVYDKKKHPSAEASVFEHHKGAKGLSQGIFKLHARNYLIIDKCDFVVCWAELGRDGKPTGGTGQGCRIAEELGIPIHNLYVPETYNLWMTDINIRKDELPPDLL